MSIRISIEHFELIKADGEGAFPNECCGFILGKHNNGEKEVRALLPTSNEREDLEQYHRFLITPQAYLQAEKYAREKGLDVIGFYHSHPGAPARPSHYDLEHAWPWYSYIIVSVLEGRAEDVTSWVLQDDRVQFNEEKIVVTDQELIVSS